MPPAGYPAFLQYLQSGRVRKFVSLRSACRPPSTHPFVIKYPRLPDWQILVATSTIWAKQTPALPEIP